MTPEDRAAGTSPVDLDHWSEVLPDDDSPPPRDLAMAARSLGYAVAIILGIIGLAVVF